MINAFSPFINLGKSFFILIEDIFHTCIGLSAQLALILLLIWPLRKLLGRLMSTKYLIRLICTVSILYLILPTYRVLIDPRMWYSVDHALLNLSIPIRISSQINGIPDTHAVDWLSLFTLIWLAGICLSLLLQRQQSKHLKKLLDRRTRCPESFQIKLQEIQKNSAHWKNFTVSKEDPIVVEVCLVEGLPSPCVCDPSRPHPYIALDRLDYTESELAHIFRHELAHISLRHERLLDSLSIVRTLCWFNPLIPLIDRWLRQQMELECDAEALDTNQATRNDRISYARLLLDLAADQKLRGAVLYLAAGSQYIRQRTEAILYPKRRILSLPLTAIIVVLALHAVLLVAPGETAEHRFRSKDTVLACIGNDFSTASRGLDPINDDKRSIRFTDKNWNMKIQKITTYDDAVCMLDGYCIAATLEQKIAGAAYAEEWISHISSYFGEPTVENAKDSEALAVSPSLLFSLISQLAPDDSPGDFEYIYRWTVSTKGASSPNAQLVLRWEQMLDEQILSIELEYL